MKRLIALIINISFFSSLVAQSSSVDEGNYVYKIISTPDNIRIDGILTEPIWDQLQVVSDFWLQAPVDDKRAETRTEVKLVYKADGIYVGAVCYDGPDYVIQTLKRDNFGESDAFGITIDPVNKKTNAYGFAVNALGAQTEVLIRPGGADGSWDNRWAVQTHQYEDRWTVEMFIPFKTLRFDESSKEWGVNFVRIEPGKNETHVWHPVPRQFDFHDMGYYGKIVWDESPGKSGTNISVIPYSAFRSNKQEGQSADTDFEVGGDAKIGLTNSLNLDLTLNPDFSQVEVDRQVTNLTRFNIFFPERRQFFIENNDLFSWPGSQSAFLFQNHRIG